MMHRYALCVGAVLLATTLQVDKEGLAQGDDNNAIIMNGVLPAGPNPYQPRALSPPRSGVRTLNGLP